MLHAHYSWRLCTHLCPPSCPFKNRIVSHLDLPLNVVNHWIVEAEFLYFVCFSLKIFFISDF